MKVLNDERGSALLLALLMIGLLSVIGLFATQTSTTETRIASNDKLQKIAFHEAEGGVHTGKELVEQNISERNWAADSLRQNVRIVDPDFITREAPGSGTLYAMDPTDPADPTTDTRRDAFFPALNPDGTVTTTDQPHTNVRVFSNPQLSTGNALQMIAGYEGEGKNVAGGGAWIIYDIRSQYHGADNSMARILARWRHSR